MKTAIILHHSDIRGDKPQFEKINAYHKRKWNGHGIAYHYLIEKSGEVKQGRPEDSLGYHAGEWNEESIGICFAGAFDAEKPTDKQIQASVELITGIQSRWGIVDQRIFLHRECRSTACPVIDLRELFLIARLSNLQKRLKHAENALKWHRGTARGNLLTRLIDRLRSVLG